MGTVGEAALRRVLAVVDLLIDADDEDALVPVLLPMLLAALPGDSVVWTPHPGSAAPLTLPRDLLAPSLLAAFRHGAAADPLVVHTTGGPGTPVRRSAMQSRAEYHALPLYADVYRKVGADDQLAMAFPAGREGGAERRVCLAVNRSGSDFTDADLAVAAMLRPRLARTLDRLHRTPPARALVSRREAEVLTLLAHGLTNEQIGHRLAISPRTVDKHLEHAYAKLRVCGRVDAANVWLAGPRP
ncbi:helix-turn-helix transcriptional regulator [Actinacidiphila bryophytorum]|uniref:Regulatory protein, luxR family n=1 Tax=Actinacidiphila bryophytorum TaxID=1436133 RepID=A0A9W4E4W6_9ACTN|nr:LuxR C-terminal-related transcriptional regulator [Actinacidiphila bryophytorum]MBM9439111.1 helix-turn-helix transcriptional regulator [Actinacidiphila bryophytorum]MBN6542923.1 helix-turn-helix transcriptional regulator [Actinacidiphila bryophytorum]CAG7622273.1 Regulatory protein, luxR family [Actinacidiphila bryophytorum]